MISMCNVKLCTLVPEVFLKIFSTKERASREAKRNLWDQGTNCVPCSGEFGVIFLKKTMYNKTIIRFGFYDIRNSQGHSKCYQPLWIEQLFVVLFATNFEINGSIYR